MSHRRSLVVIDDCGDSRMLLEALLSERYDLLALYSDGASALDHLGVVDPDAVLLDISMPGLDGNQVLKRIREDGRWTCVLAMTAHANPGDTRRWQALGFDGSISKPIVDPQQLYQAIDEAITNS